MIRRFPALVDQVFSALVTYSALGTLQGCRRCVSQYHAGLGSISSSQLNMKPRGVALKQAVLLTPGHCYQLC